MSSEVDICPVGYRVTKSLLDLGICMNTTFKLNRKAPRWGPYPIFLCVSHCVGLSWELNSCAAEEQTSNGKSSKVINARSLKQLAFTSAGHSIRTDWVYTANSALHRSAD